MLIIRSKWERRRKYRWLISIERVPFHLVRLKPVSLTDTRSPVHAHVFFESGAQYERALSPLEAGERKKEIKRERKRERKEGKKKKKKKRDRNAFQRGRWDGSVSDNPPIGMRTSYTLAYSPSRFHRYSSASTRIVAHISVVFLENVVY